MKICNRLYFVSGLCFLLMLLFSCSLSDELDKINSIKSIEASGSFNSNVLKDTLYLRDLITKDNLDLKENSLTGDYSFSFVNNSSYKIDPIIFPKININPFVVALPPEYLNPLIPFPAGEYVLPTVKSSFSLETPKIGTTSFPVGFNIATIKLKTGAKISLTLKNEFNVRAKIKVTIPTLTKNGVVYSKIFDNIAANSVSNLTIDELNGYTLFTNKMGIEIETTIKKTTIAPISGSKMSFSSIIDIAAYHESVEGFFGEIVLNPDPLSVSITLPDGFKKNATSDMIIKETTISLTVSKNNITLPIDLDLIGEGIKVQKQVTSSNVFEFKIYNLNILNLDQLKLTPVVTINKGLLSGENKLTDISSLNFNAKVEIPMDITAKDLVFEQEGDNALYDEVINEADFEFKDGKVRLIGTIDSEIPLGASVQVYYRNSANGTEMLSLFNSPIVIQSGKTKLDVEVTTEKLNLIKKYPFQVIKVAINGSGKINSNQKIIFNIGIAAKGTFISKI